MSHPAAGDENCIRVVLIEDDERLARLTSRYLESHGALVTWCADGREGLAEVLRSRPDVVLLDLMLPAMDGLTVCKELRTRCDIPILMITAREEEADRVLGLEMGADDYIVKPYSSREMLARVRAQVRRARGKAGPRAEHIEVGRLSVQPASMEALLDGVSLALTTYEFELLRVFSENVGRVLSREQLLFLTRGNAEESFDRSIDVHISRLRQKLGDDSRQPKLLKTVRGLGYMLVAGDHQ